MGDDLVPNYGGTDYFDVPDERVEAESVEANTFASANPFLLDIDQWWTDQVTMSDHTTHIDPTSPISIEAQWYARQLLHDALQEKQAEWADFAETLRNKL